MSAREPEPGADRNATVRTDQPPGRWVLLATVLGSGMAALDATVVNIALPVLGRELDAGLGELQWVVNGYTLTLAALILLGGSLGDRYGRRRIFVLGTVWFALASLGCALAPSIEALIAARAVQGIGGALLTPGSLAIIQASFVPEHRARAVGAWSGLAGIAGAAGPFLGGWLIAIGGWRWIFLINLPLAALVITVATRRVPESRAPSARGFPDLPGAGLCALGLAGITYALSSGSTTAEVYMGLAGAVAFAGFLLTERLTKHPMLPLGIFTSRRFSAVNLVTLAVYGALGGVFFLLVLYLQVVVGFSALSAGAALLPVTVIMLTLSAPMGTLAQRIGPRKPMATGPVVAAAGLVLMTRIGSGSGYLVDVLPAVVVFGFGLAITVAPLTSTALAAAGARHAGLASGVNNAVARTAQLLAVAAIPTVVGLSGDDYTRPARFEDAFGAAMLVCAGLLVLGGVLSAVSIPDVLPQTESGSASAEAGSTPGGRARNEGRSGRSEPGSHCAVDGPPLLPGERSPEGDR